MKRGFTLIELLVVISIISMLATIVIVSTVTVQAKARDSKRIQEVRQIDLATRLYIEKYNHAPYLDNPGCAVQQSVPSSVPSGCIAVSTPGVVADANWTSFKTQIAEFMPKVPSDPCGSSCTSLSGLPIGYTYIAPLAMQYYCSLAGALCSGSVNGNSYEMYAPLEKQIPSYGSNGLNTSYFSPAGIGDVTPPSVPQNVVLVIDSSGPGTLVQVSWNASTDTGGAGLAGYKVYFRFNGGPLSSPVVVQTNSYSSYMILSLSDNVCVEVASFDNNGNQSANSAQKCSPII